jgi:hypothetical protein
MSTPSDPQDLHALAREIIAAISKLKCDGAGEAAKKAAIEASKKLIQQLTDPRKRGMELMLNVQICILYPSNSPLRF